MNFNGLIIGLIAVAIFYAISRSKRGKDVVNKLPDYVKEFRLNMPPDRVLKIIVNYVNSVGYSVSHLDIDKGEIVLDESASISDWGFFYPIRVFLDSDGKTRISIGIRGKIHGASKSQIRSRMDKLVNGIKAAIYTSK